MRTKEFMTMTIVGAVLLVLGVLLVFPLGYGIVGLVLMGAGAILLAVGVGMWVREAVHHHGPRMLHH